MLEHVRGKPGTAIAERERRFPAVGREADVDPRRIGARLSVDRILKQIVEHLAKPGRLAQNDDRCVRQRERDMRAQIVV